MRVISEKQQRFVDFVYEENRKPIDVNDGNAMFRMIVLNLFQIYIIAEKESDRMATAWRIASIREDLKMKIKLWDLIEDKEEFKRLVLKRKENTDKMVKENQRRRHEKRDDFALTDEEWLETVDHFDGCCAYCGENKKLTYDHFHPFSKGGDFMKGNIIPCCKTCNSSKLNKKFADWYPNQKFYNKQREKKVISYIEQNRQLTLL